MLLWSLGRGACTSAYASTLTRSQMLASKQGTAVGLHAAHWGTCMVLVHLCMLLSRAAAQHVDLGRLSCSWQHLCVCDMVCEGPLANSCNTLAAATHLWLRQYDCNVLHVPCCCWLHAYTTLTPSAHDSHAVLWVCGMQA